MAGERIIIAEDEKHARLSLSLVLRQNGYQVCLAEDGQKALEEICSAWKEGAPFDLLLTDIQMPKLNGLQLIDRLQEERIDVPVVGITGFGDKEMVVDLLRRGCSEYLDKPLNPEDVLERVVKVLKKEKAARHARHEKTHSIEKEREHISLELSGYKQRLTELTGQMDSAVNAYQKLIDVDAITASYPVFLRNQPLAMLGGDFVDIRATDTGLDIFMADVAGHDMGASYHTVLLKAFFDQNCQRGNDGYTFFQLLNKQIYDNGKNERMVTALFIRLDLQECRGQIISAGHPPVFFLRQEAEHPRMLNTESMVLGLFNRVEFNTHDIHLKPGDKLLLFTDGLYSVSRRNPANGKQQRLGLEGFFDLFQAHCRKDMELVVDGIWQDTQEFCHNKPNDDMLLAGIEIP